MSEAICKIVKTTITSWSLLAQTEQVESSAALQDYGGICLVLKTEIEDTDDDDKRIPEDCPY